MEYSRRQILQNTGILFAPMAVRGSISNSGESLCGEDADLPAPEPPGDATYDTVTNEAYGELGLSPDQKCWVFPIKPSHGQVENSEQLTIEYEVRTEEEVSPPDILVLSEQGLDYYDTHVNEPFFRVKEWCSHEIFGRGISLPCSIGDIEFNPDDSGVVWEQGHNTLDIYSAQCLNTSPYRSPVRKSETIPSGYYYVVFDWTDAVFDNANDEVSAEVSIRAKHPRDPRVIEEKATDEVETVYSRLPEERSRLVAVSRSMATDICTDIEVPDTGAVVATAPRGTQLAATANAVLPVLERAIGVRPVFAERISEVTSTWTRWGMSTLPVIYSLNRLHDDACALERANPEQVFDRVEDFLLSVGILVGDLVLLKFGVASKLAHSLTRVVHRHLLGFLGRVLGLRTYVVLLREVFNLTRSSLTEGLRLIKQLTEDIVEDTTFLSDEAEGISAVHSMTSPDDLYSLDGFDLGQPDLNPLNDCRPIQ